MKYKEEYEEDLAEGPTINSYDLMKAENILNKEEPLSIPADTDSGEQSNSLVQESEPTKSSDMVSDFQKKSQQDRIGVNQDLDADDDES